MHLNQLQTQSAFFPLSSMQHLWHQVHQVATQAGQSLLQSLVIAPDPKVVVHRDRNNQTTVHINDLYHGTHHTFTSQEDAIMWLEKGRFM